MKLHSPLAAVTAASALAFASASTAGATPSARPAHPTWHVTVAPTGQQIAGTTYLETDTVAMSGSPIGLALLTCPGSAQGGIAVSHCNITFGLEGGTLSATVSLNNSSGAVTGRLVGGTGRFHGATGKVSGRGQNSGAKLDLTFTHAV